MVSASSGRVFALGWWRRGPVGTRRNTLVVLYPGLEEPRDPLEGRSGRLGGLALLDLAGVLTHGGRYRRMVVGGSGLWISCRLSKLGPPARWG